MASSIISASPASSARRARPPLDILRAGLGGLLIAAACWPLTTRAPEPIMTPVSPPRAAPNFTLRGIDGKTHSLREYRGRVVLLNFWATWCPPCRAEMPSIERLYASMKGKPFVVLALDQGEGDDNVFAFMGQLNPSPTFPVLLDAKSAVAHAFGVMGIPSTYLIDKQGRIVAKVVGGRNYDTPAMLKLLNRQ